MKDLKRILVAAPALALAIFLIAAYMTRGAMQHLPAIQRGGAANGELVDQRPWQTVVALAPLAVSAEEQNYAREAARVADHEVDQAFAMALRQSSMQPRALQGAALALEQRIADLQKTQKEDQAQVDALTAAARKAPGAAGSNQNPAPETGDDLDVAKAQLALDGDELAGAVQDLARITGDKRTKIQQELAAHEAAMKKSGENLTGNGEIAVISAKRYGTLYGRAGAWFAQRNRLTLIAQAEHEARADVQALTAQRNTFASAPASQTVPPASGPGSLTGVARVKILQQIAARRAVLSILDDRIQSEGQLATVYQRWEAQVWMQRAIVDHTLALSFAAITFIVLMAVLVDRLGRMLLERLSTDRRQLHTLRTIFALSVQAVGLLLILLVIFGPPSQTPTILGLATAGLTVVFQDFIIAFCGWFVLMGKHGIRVGDWVEINAVGGEVIEIGLFRTALLETGNWTSRGHPTGRRVTFLNGYAIRGQYFNFSTAGQWLWDEIKLSLPPAVDSAQTVEKILAMVAKETEKDTQQAEEEWRRVVQENSLSQFSARPTADLRPAASGVDVIVRYVTRASERFDLRNRLYLQMVGLLQQAALPAEVK